MMAHNSNNAIKRSLWCEIFDYLKAGGPSFLNGNEVIRSYKGKPHHYLSLLLNKDRDIHSLSKKMIIGITNIRELQEIYKKNEILCLGGLRDALHCQKNSLSYVSYCVLKSDLYDCWINKDLKKFENLQQIATELLKKNKINKLLVSNDSLPLERLIINAARNLGIKSFCFQHGLFSKQIPEINDGRYADSLLCYDIHQLNILIHSGARNPIEIGYPFNQSNESISKDRKTVVFLGQPWARYYKNKLEQYLKIIEAIKRICEINGLILKYKPHPAETMKIDRLIAGLTLYKEDLQSAFEDNYLFCSISSTALLQASLAGKVAIQIYDNNFIKEIYEDFGYCHTRSIDDQHSLTDCLKHSTPKKIMFTNKRLTKLKEILSSGDE